MPTTSGLVLFDFDGTIADSLSVAVAAFNAAAPGLGIRPLDAGDSRLRHMNPREAMRAGGVPLWKLPSLVSAVRTGMHERMDTVALFPGIDVAIAHLQQSGYRCGIVSSNSRSNIDRFLVRHRITSIPILGSGASIFGKPSVLKKVLRSEGVSPAGAFYVGDEVRDIVASAEVGLRSVAVSWGYAAREALAAERPTLLVDRTEDLARAILEHR